MTSLRIHGSTAAADSGSLEPQRRGPQLGLRAGANATIRDWVARRRRRRSLARLSELDDHLLDDIGLSRPEALREAAKWFWQR
jgi:uncharacterized protein YjiS (DUF1127 family)